MVSDYKITVSDKITNIIEMLPLHVYFELSVY